MQEVPTCMLPTHNQKLHFQKVQNEKKNPSGFLSHSSIGSLICSLHYSVNNNEASVFS